MVLEEVLPADERPRPWYAPLARHEGTRRPAARQPRNAGCPASARGAPLLARVPLRPAGAGHAGAPALPAARAGDPAAPAPDLGGGLSEDLDARGLAAPRPQPGARREGPGAPRRRRPGGARDALRPARDRERSRPLRKGRGAPPDGVPALPAIQLRRHRLGDRGGRAARGRTLERSGPPDRPAVLRSPGLRRGARRAGAAVPHADARARLLQLPWPARAPDPQGRSVRQPLPRAAGLLRRDRAGESFLLPRPVPRRGPAARRAPRRARGAPDRLLSVAPGALAVAVPQHRGGA